MRKLAFWVIFGSLVAGLIAMPGGDTARTRLADGFDFPVGKPDAEGYYMARGFRANSHLGEDWNGVGGGNTDLGDPIYTIANGIVVFARDVRLGWGNVVIIRHAYLEGGQLKLADSLYGHLDRIDVREGQHVEKGQMIGTMGNNRGMYSAHLHFEIRKNIYIGINRSQFRRDLTAYHIPSAFIKGRRSLPGGGRSSLIAVNTFNHGRDFNNPVDEAQLRANRGNRSAARTSVTANRRSAPAPKKDFRVNRYDDVQSF